LWICAAIPTIAGVFFPIKLEIPFRVGGFMTKEKLVEKIKELLRTDRDLSFLLQLEKKEIEKLLACIRDRVDQVGS